MKTTSFTLLILLFCCQWLVAQCPPYITFSTQGQIDSFQINYPGCTDVPGDLNLSGIDINSLSGLSSITTIGGSFYISGIPTLTSLSGLENLTAVAGEIWLFNCPLPNLNGLNSLSSIGSFIMGGMDSLINLAGLENVDSIPGYLYIGGYANLGNAGLKNLIGLDNLISVGELTIADNMALESLCGLNKNLSITNGLWINGNSSLPNCQIESVCSYLSNPISFVNIENNAPGCNSQVEVVTACSLWPQADHYVDDTATGAGNGTSWADAFNDLQDALAIAAEGDEIWVAEGIYKPDTIGGNQTSTFLIDKNLKLYGGFMGLECLLTERPDTAEHPSVLSGDLNGDDIENNLTDNRSDNTENVLRINAGVNNTSVFDGFTIKGGHAEEVNYVGGGIRSMGSPVIRHCVFTQNFASNWGGGMSVSGASSQNLQLENCNFSNNRAGYGGGIDIDAVPGEGIGIQQCSFSNNKSFTGGAISSYNTNLSIFASSFDNNTNLEQGGGLWFLVENTDNISLEVDNCSFDNNESSFGGGLYFGASADDCTLWLNNTTFAGNAVFPMGNGWGQGGGGALIVAGANASNTLISIDSCSFLDNSSTEGGGGLNLFPNGGNFNCTVNQCFFWGNTATFNGGGIGLGPQPNTIFFENYGKIK